MARGFTQVRPTEQELRKNPRPRVYRLQCNACGKRIWGSGLGIGAHNRSNTHREAWVAAMKAGATNL